MRKLLKLLANISIFTIAVAMLLNIYNQYHTYLDERVINEALVSRIQEEQDRQVQILYQLEHHLSYEFVEMVARNQLGFVKSTEIVFIDMTQ